MWQAKEIKQSLKGNIFGKQIHTFDEVGSTQDIAHTLASFGSPEGTLIIAETQTAGIGTSGKNWVSPPGGLWFSLILTPTLINISQASGLTILIGHSLARVIRKETNLPVLVKWPNDLYLNNKKVAGILSESSSVEVAVKYIIVGIGINVNVDSASLPFGATSLKSESGKEIQRMELLVKILEAIEKDYLTFKVTHNLQLFLKEINEWSLVVGQKVKVRLPDKSIIGYGQSIDEQGHLIVELEDGKTEIIIAGTVSLI